MNLQKKSLENTLAAKTKEAAALHKEFLQKRNVAEKVDELRSELTEKLKETGALRRRLNTTKNLADLNGEIGELK